MNKRLGIVIAFALVISAVASAVVYRMISARMGLNGRANTAVMLVAARDLPVGTLIVASDLRTVDWQGYVPPRALRHVEEVIGRGVTQGVYEGDPMLDSRLAPRGAGGGLAATIPPGMRAVAVRVDELVGVSGFVVPGMKVDVVISGTPPSTTGFGAANRVAKIVLQNIAVLSAGQNMQKDVEGKPVAVAVVNLLVTPEQAERLSLASNETRIQLVLRNPLDTTETATRGIALAALFSGVEGPPAQPVVAPRPRLPRPPPPVQPVVAAPPAVVVPVEQSLTVEVLHGNDRARARFSAAGATN